MTERLQIPAGVVTEISATTGTDNWVQVVVQGTDSDGKKYCEDPNEQIYYTESATQPGYDDVVKLFAYSTSAQEGDNVGFCTDLNGRKVWAVCKVDAAINITRGSM